MDFSKSGRPIHDPGLVEAANSRQADLREEAKRSRREAKPRRRWRLRFRRRPRRDA